MTVRLYNLCLGEGTVRYALKANFEQSKILVVLVTMQKYNPLGLFVNLFHCRTSEHGNSFMLCHVHLTLHVVLISWSDR